MRKKKTKQEKIDEVIALQKDCLIQSGHTEKEADEILGDIKVLSRKERKKNE